MVKEFRPEILSEEVSAPGMPMAINQPFNSSCGALSLDTPFSAVARSNQNSPDPSPSIVVGSSMSIRGKSSEPELEVLTWMRCWVTQLYVILAGPVTTNCGTCCRV